MLRGGAPLLLSVASAPAVIVVAVVADTLLLILISSLGSCASHLPRNDILLRMKHLGSPQFGSMALLHGVINKANSVSFESVLVTTSIILAGSWWR